MVKNDISIIKIDVSCRWETMIDRCRNFIVPCVGGRPPMNRFGKLPKPKFNIMAVNF